MTHSSTRRLAASAARAQAYLLLVEASHRDDIPIGCALYCHTAANALDLDHTPAGNKTFPPGGTAQLIRAALARLAALPAEEFAAPDVRQASRFARRAVLELPR
jgi:hypothetical protein